MGGSKPQAPQFITPPAPTITQAPPPNIQQNAADLYKAQLEYNPLLTKQATDLQMQYGPELAKYQYDLQNQYGPQYAQSQYDIQAQFAPLYRQLYESLFSSQTQGLEMLSQQANYRLQNPMALTQEQQSQQDFMRQRGREQIQRNVRESSNLGGTLYGGRRQGREDEALRTYESGLLDQDLNRQYQNRAQTLQELIAAQQVAFPQIQQPGVQSPGVAQYGQGVTPSPDALLQAILQGQLVQQPVYQPGNAGTPGFFGSAINAFTR